jgi:hypothetical protein
VRGSADAPLSLGKHERGDCRGRSIRRRWIHADATVWRGDR